MRIFKDSYDMIREINRELLVQGISVECNSYQNKKLEGENRIVKELLGVSFLISKPLNKRKEMLDYMFKEESDKIEHYCIQEHCDRVSGMAFNPGHSYKIRQDMWQKFMVDSETKFDYTYAERFWNLDQMGSVIQCLKEDKGTRQAILMIFQPQLDSTKRDGNTRIPCSISYQFMIRNNRLYNLYYMRSNSMFEHMPIDIWLASELINWMTEQLKPTYPELKTGSLIYMAGSLHAFSWNLKKWVIF